MKDVCNMRSILFVSVDKKMIFPHNEWYIGNFLVCAHFFKTSTLYNVYCETCHFLSYNNNSRLLYQDVTYHCLSCYTIEILSDLKYFICMVFKNERHKQLIIYLYKNNNTQTNSVKY